MTPTEYPVKEVEKFARDARSFMILLKSLYDEADKELAVDVEPSPMRLILNDLVERGDKIFYMKGLLL